MTDRDRVKLQFGPYRPPPLKRGDRATCLFRDATVIITAWSDAPIPWPRFRALDSTGGRQWVVGYDGEQVYGVSRDDEAVVVKGGLAT